MAAFLLNKKICQTACIVAIFTACSATATTIAGFINMGSFHATHIEACVGIWCGLTLFLSVFMGLLMMGTRHMVTAVIYLIVNCLCLGLSILGVIISVGYWEDFNEFRKLSDNLSCSSSQVNGNRQCLCTKATEVTTFKTGFSVRECQMLALGEDLWLGTIVLVASCIFWSAAGVIIALAAIFTEVGTEKGFALQNNGFRYDSGRNM